ncbi:MAG: methanol dehydrogenase, partial [Sphingomonadales bacterium]
MRAFALTLAAFAAMISLPATAQDFPELSGRVVDEANIIPDDVEQQLTQQLEALEQQSQRQLVVATVPDLQGYDISDYGYQLG